MDQVSKDLETVSKSVAYQSGIFFFLQGGSSVTIMILNKYLATYFNFPILILIGQNSVATMLSVGAWYAGFGPSMKPWKREHFIKVIPMAVLFTILLYTSFITMHYLAIPTVVVFRNAGPLFTALGERYLGTNTMSQNTTISLSLMIVGAFFYGFNDLQFNFVGYTWAFTNLLCTAASGLFGKHLSMNLKEEQTGLGLACYQNIVSAPMFFIVAVMTGEASKWQTIGGGTEIPAAVWLAGIVSSVGCVSMGLSTFELQRLVAQSSIAVANVCYKLITLIVGVLVFGNNVGFLGLVGLCIAQGAAIMYVYDKQFGAAAVEAARRKAEEARAAEAVPLAPTNTSKEEA